jgi:hypothetical protein
MEDRVKARQDRAHRDSTPNLSTPCRHHIGDWEPRKKPSICGRFPL